MDKDLQYVKLFGIYGNLLTEHQKDLFNLYYECDLSLGEIAEIHGISRQSVNDALKKSREILLDIESKLGFLDKFSKINERLILAKNSKEEEVCKLAEDISRALEDV